MLSSLVELAHILLTLVQLEYRGEVRAAAIAVVVAVVIRLECVSAVNDFLACLCRAQLQ